MMLVTKQRLKITFAWVTKGEFQQFTLHLG